MENSKLYYIPLYPEQEAPLLAISAEPLDGQSADPPVVSRGTDDYAWSQGGFPFYATGTLLAHQGRRRHFGGSYALPPAFTIAPWPSSMVMRGVVL